MGNCSRGKYFFILLMFIIQVGSALSQLNCEAYKVVKTDDEFAPFYGYLNKKLNAVQFYVSELSILPSGDFLSISVQEDHVMIQKYTPDLKPIKENKIDLLRDQNHFYYGVKQLGDNYFLMYVERYEDGKSKKMQNLICETINTETLALTGDKITLLDNSEEFELTLENQFRKEELNSQLFISFSPDKTRMVLLLYHMLNDREKGQFYVKVINSDLSEQFHHSYSTRYNNETISGISCAAGNSGELAVTLTLSGTAYSYSLFLTSFFGEDPKTDEIIKQFETYSNVEYMVRGIQPSFTDDLLFCFVRLDGKTGGLAEDEMIAYTYYLPSGRLKGKFSIRPLDFLNEAEAAQFAGKPKEDKYNAISMEFTPHTATVDDAGNIYVLSFYSIPSFYGNYFHPVCIMKFNYEFQNLWAHLFLSTSGIVQQTMIHNKLHLLCNAYTEIKCASVISKGEAFNAVPRNPKDKELRAYDISFSASGEFEIERLYENCDPQIDHTLMFSYISAWDKPVILVYSRDNEKKPGCYINLIKFKE